MMDSSGRRTLKGLLKAVLVTAAVIGSTAVTASSAAGRAAVCPTSVSVAQKALPVFRPPLTQGDNEFGGHGPAVTVSATRELWTTGSVDTLLVRVMMRAEETTDNWTAAAGSTAFTLYTAPAGCRINSELLKGGFDSNGYLGRSNYANPYPLAAGSVGINGSFVQGYTVWDDRSGSDVGTYTGVQVVTKAFSVTFH